MGPRYQRLRIRLPGAQNELEDLVAAWLWEQGTVGIEFQPGNSGESVLVATFEAEKLPVKADLRGLAALVPGVDVVDFGPVEEKDWLAAWRESAEPIPLGDRLLVDPREWDLGVAAVARTPRGGSGAEGAIGERFVLAIPARTAFGVGSHESTRLAYELLESTPLAGKRVLDVGCGSGILAMAALLLGARAAVGFDFDPAAGLLAGQYARHNGLAPAIFTGTVAALAPPATPAANAARFEVVVLNVLPHEIAEELEQVIAQLAPGGDLLISGVLETEAPAVTKAVERFDCDATDQIRAGEWVGLRFNKRQELAGVTP